MGTRRLLFLILPVLLLSGCLSMQDPEAAQGNSSAVVGSISDGHNIGQSFISRRARLDGILLWLHLSPNPSPSGTLVAELYHSPQDITPLDVKVYSFSDIAKSVPLQLAFAPQPGPAGQEYYLSLKAQNGSLQAMGSGEDGYPQGQAFINGNPQNSDLAFRLLYDYSPASLLEDLKNILLKSWLILPLIICLLLPGWLLLDLAGLANLLDGGEKAGLALGLSLSVFPILMLWTSLLGIAWNRSAVLAVGCLLGVAAIWRWSRRKRSQERAGGPVQPSQPEPSDGVSIYMQILPLRRLPEISPTGLGLSAVFALALAVRLVMVRDLAAPAWVDSVHHALITRLILERGAFPQSYAPYLDISTASYHPGFHTALAVFNWLSGLEIPEAMLLFGQVLNAASVFAVYLLTTTLTGRRTAGVFAALLSGIFMPMPAYYTSWGRYTELAGLLILPAAISLIIRLINNKPKSPPLPFREGGGRGGLGLLLLSSLACGGLFLSHYRVAAFLACLLGIVWISRLIFHDPLRLGRKLRLWWPINRRSLEQPALLAQNRWPEGSLIGWQISAPAAPQAKCGMLVKPAHNSWREQAAEDGHAYRHSLLAARGWAAVWSDLKWLIWAGLLAILLTLPWWRPTLETLVLPTLHAQGGAASQLFGDFTWRYLDAGLGKYTLYLAGLGLAWGILRRQGFAWILVFWVAVLFVIANLGALGLPGGSFISNSSVEIALFMPVAVLGGFFIEQMLVQISLALPAGWRPGLYGTAAGAAAALALFGATRLVTILNPDTFLFRQADRPALQWIDSHLPQQATILINPFAWGYGLYAGNDGGYWITPLTGRKTIPPPVLYGYDTEAGNIQRVNQISQQVIEQSANPTALHDLLKPQGISYVFTGRRGGVLSPQLLLGSGLFEPLYSQDGVWIFRVK